ncbi:map1lc3b [Trichonephila inaurata madagascariensis]|uniref:Map1lc3b n=1 Tax=Trichonephila inaurata madagascariensis TaxID=2747483 RepID=A0A8X6XYR3_9ARAC|nr:map1lc3b [Trichonephila inaurata madagascariensis]
MEHNYAKEMFSSGILYGVSLGAVYTKIMDAPEREKKFGKFIPIIIENHTNGLKKSKLMVPSHYRASQLLNILRAKMQMSSVTPLYLFLKGKHRPLQASKCIGHLHQKYRNEKGCLHLIQADQSTFGFRGNIRAIRFRHKWMENYPRQAPLLATFLLQDPILPSESLQLTPTEGFINPVANELQPIPPGPMPVIFDFIEPNPPDVLDLIEPNPPDVLDFMEPNLPILPDFGEPNSPDMPDFIEPNSPVIQLHSSNDILSAIISSAQIELPDSSYSSDSDHNFAAMLDFNNFY